MNYEEKRELRLQISQILADAGLNQKTIKYIVNEEIRNKVERAVDQAIRSLNAETWDGDYVKSQIRSKLNDTYLNQRAFSDVVKEELKNRVINVTLCGLEDITVIK